MGWSVPVRAPGLPPGPANGVARGAPVSMAWGAGWRIASIGCWRTVTTGASPGRRPRRPVAAPVPLRSRRCRRPPGRSGGVWRPCPDGGRRPCRRESARPRPTMTGPMRPVSVCPAGGDHLWPGPPRLRPPHLRALRQSGRCPRSPCPRPPPVPVPCGPRGGPCRAPAAAAEPRLAAVVVLRRAAWQARRCLRLGSPSRPVGRTFNHEQLGGGGFPDLGGSPAGAP